MPINIADGLRASVVGKKIYTEAMPGPMMAWSA